MKKRNVVRRLFDLEKTECMKELQKYDQGIGMKKQLTAAAKELSEDLQDTLLGKRRLAQRLLRCWATFDLFKQCVKETNLISELEKALHSRKDDEVKRSVLDSLMYLLSNEGYDVRQAILSKDVNGVLPLQLLLDSSDDQTAHSAMAAMEGLLKYDRPERPDSGRTHSSGLLQSSANAQLFIRMLVTLRRSIKASQYVRDAAFHTLHRLYDEQPDVKAILSAHGHADIRRQFKRIGKRHEGEDPEKQEALVSHG
ncbi:hypothetical protein NEOLEDRAFT_539211 [Neolentinus lepideus HHB14362 ss-1]|uniref:ARM repeat-containing protein n=1 Tax=Neolentinus lepideus HHB14362 ss-1 TaxID=1314782 RepID=A0A165RBM3_9AGAM|nr:hypothetical protein NEOLEDRAFT_539211 [Neolentinus lepideus HHB14362 ss-1]